MTVVVSATFAGTDATAIADYVPGTVPGTNRFTSRSGAWQLSSNMAHPSSASNLAHATIESGTTNGVITAEARMNSSNTSLARVTGIVFRWTDASNYWMCGFLIKDQVTSTFYIVQVSSGTPTSRASTNLALAADTMYTVQITLSGNDMSATLEGANTITYSSSTGASSTVHGICGRDTTSYVDDFVVDDGSSGGTSYNQNAAGSLTSAGVIVRDTAHLLTGSLSSAGSLAKRVARAIAGSLNSGSSTTYTDGPGGDVTTSVDLLMSSTWPTFGGGTHPDAELVSTQAAMLRFNLSAIPAGAVCTGATLYLYHSFGDEGGGSNDGNVYSVAAANGDWVEGTKNIALAGAGEPCWNAKAADGSGGVTTAWAGSAGCQTAGTDYESTSMGTYSWLPSSAIGTEITVALSPSRVQGWFGASNTNYGIILITSAGSNNAHIGLSENSTAGYRPKLVVTYQNPGITGALTRLKSVLASVGGTLTSAGAVVRRAGKTLAGSTTPAGGLVRQVGHLVSGALSSAGGLARQAAKTFAGSVSSAAGLATSLVHGLYTQAVGGALSLAGTVSRSTSHLISGALSSAGGLAKMTARVMTGALSSAGALAKRTGKILAGSMSNAGAVATSLVHGLYTQAIDGALSLVGGLSKQAQILRGGTLSSSGALGKLIAKAFTGTLAYVGSGIGAFVGDAYNRAVSGLLALAGTLASVMIARPHKSRRKQGSLAGQIYDLVNQTTDGAASLYNRLRGKRGSK